MCFERFDQALLYILSVAEGALPFTVREIAYRTWFVFQNDKCLGRIQESGEMYEAAKVQFIPYSGATHHEKGHTDPESCSPRTEDIRDN